MTHFSATQQSFEINGVQIGGQPGDVPTVLIGSIFYHGHKIVSDAKEGHFNRKKAQQLIETQDQMMEKTGNPCMLDVVIDSKEVLTQYIDFVAETTNCPLLLDSSVPSIRIAAIEYAEEIGLLSRVIYNSLSPKSTKEELERLQHLRVEQAILLALDPQLVTTSGRIEVIKNSEGNGLVDVAQKCGITKQLVDTCVLDVPSLGIASKTIMELKDQFGMVCGCGSHNAIETWGGLTTKFRSNLRETGIAAVAVFATTAGADFILYGPVDNANAVFPMVAMVDAAWGQVIFEQTRKVNRAHPLFKIA